MNSTGLPPNYWCTDGEIRQIKMLEPELLTVFAEASDVPITALWMDSQESIRPTTIHSLLGR